VEFIRWKRLDEATIHDTWMQAGESVFHSPSSAWYPPMREATKQTARVEGSPRSPGRSITRSPDHYTPPPTAIESAAGAEALKFGRGRRRDFRLAFKRARAAE
jgi:hypothetical protein